MINLEEILILCSFFFTAYSQNQDSKASQFISQNKLLIGVLCFLIMLIVAIYLDKRNGYKYITIVRLKAGDVIVRLRNIRLKKVINKKEKIQTEQSIPTSKQMRNIFDNEKTFVEGPPSAHEAIVFQKNAEEIISNMEQEDTPKVNLRQVFQQKVEQNHQKRSKSKIRNRVQIKKSQIQDEASKNTPQVTENSSNQPNLNE